MNLKELLKNELNEDELSLLKTAYDIVGDIAILEIPDELIKKEHIIATKIIESKRNINVVVKKDGNHEGTFRLQHHKHLAGENRKTTTYKENGCELLINIDETYFSPRLSTERQRIIKLVKDNENILVMFSGIAPYPITISKNTKARFIYGVELNPKAHEKAIENLKLNKIRNVVLFNDDATKVERFYNLITGLKTAINKEEFENKYNLISKHNDKPIIELFVKENDITNMDKNLFNEIKKRSSKLILHGFYISDGANTKTFIETFNKTKELITNNNILDDIDMIVIHLPKIEESEAKEFYYNLRKIIKNNDENIISKIALENMPWGYFSDLKHIKRLLTDVRKIDKVCYDIGHHCIALQKENKTMTYDDLKKKINQYLDTFDYKKQHLYFHSMNVDLDDGVIEDHKTLNETLLIGKIKQDYFTKLTYGVLENINKNELIAQETKESLTFIDSLNDSMPKKFDRILMPLPKDSELFLVNALKVTRKGTMIHMYHFCHIDNLEDFKTKVISIAKKANYEINIKDVIKCGDFSPKVHRWCLDIEIL